MNYASTIVQRLEKLTYGIHPIKDNKAVSWIKEYIDSGLDIKNGFVIEFNEDFNKLKKWEI